MFTILFTASLFYGFILYGVSSQEGHQYCVVGAGPGGLQIGYFLERAQRDYVIFEANSVAGSFFLKYPCHRKLISINKRFTGRLNKEFNLRHDWNSLLSDDDSLLLKHYSDKFYPDADDLVKYLNDYATKLRLNIKYNTTIKIKANLKDKGFLLNDQHGNMFECKQVIVSTGLGKENIPDNFKGVEHTESYTDISMDPKQFEGQTVLIIGRGNSGFETAAGILGSTNHIHMFSRSRLRLSWETHYVGDLRAVNNEVLDTYQLKSLDGLLEVPVEIMAIRKKNNKLYIDTTIGKGADNFAIREPYDRVIRCMGFKFDDSIFDNSTLPRPSRGRYLRKLPSMTAAYESNSIPGIYYAGTNTHYVDFRKSAGGFIHGFRYTARALHRILEWKNHRVTWPHVKVPITDLLGVIMKRINEASGIYQMFGILGEVIIFRSNDSVEYYEEVPLKLLHKFEEYTGRSVGPMIVINMEYGRNYSGPGKDVFNANRARAAGDPSVAHHSNFLHPVLYFYKQPPKDMNEDSQRITELPRPDRLHVMVEDFLTLWDAPVAHFLLLRRFMEEIVQEDLRYFYAKSCFEMFMTYTSVPKTCQQQYLNGQMLPGSPEILQKSRSLGLML
ncbi:FAD-dependent oxidoreductase domain-containing protein 2-like [Actinia tenebrosa]|uniref:FAD-dependent oxidoreductase domain-containing protein 2-like n=1 Tax=Actinia tenebrosa TaxID=6105 RepID=A0A6P8J5Q3_ACTTE|nr:FAD-dependent oxidoreductase domain-containing protein 2-like [Actinia tenebrosa]